MAAKFAAIFFTMILVDNYVLVQFLGICPFLGVSKRLDSAVGMSLAVTFVMVLATAATWPIQMFLLTPESGAWGMGVHLPIQGIRETKEFRGRTKSRDRR